MYRDYMAKPMNNIDKTPFSYLIATDTQLKNIISSSKNSIELLDEILDEFCMHEFGKYNKGAFKSYLYTSIVQKMNNGVINGIVPDVPWYASKFLPPKGATEWIPVEELQLREPQPIQDSKSSDIDKRVSGIETMLQELMTYVTSNSAKPNS